MQASFEIIESQAGQRLDKFLSEQCETSRAQVQKWIKLGGVIVNDKPTDVPHYLLRTGDHVNAASVAPPEPAPDTAQEHPEALHPVVRAEEPTYLVIEKPAGLMVHRDNRTRYTLADWIRERYPECTAVGDKPDERPGIVHRLDKDASGLMLIARTQAMFDHLKQQFMNHDIYKEYSALVHDVLPPEVGAIDFPIMRSTQEARMSARPISQGGKPAVTEYEVITRYTNATLVRVTPKTGRTHQIRVHFFALGYPLVGDSLYFNKKDKRKLDAALGRLFLHATKLRFTDLKGETVEYESGLPEELKNFLETLKVKH